MAAAAKTRQPQALPLCAARGDRADREGRALRADRHRSRQQAGLVPQGVAARQDAGAAGRRSRDLRVRRDPRISRGDAGQSAASRQTRCAAPSIAPGSNSARPCSTTSPDSIRRPTKPRSRPRRRSSKQSSRGWRARVDGPWFDGEKFSLVDAVFGPVFRYFDVFDRIGDFGILADKPKLKRWRENLAARPSVRSAVGADYPALLRDFIDRRRSLPLTTGGEVSRLRALPPSSPTSPPYSCCARCRSSRRG